MSQSSKILVTGGSGFLGSWCIKVLLERGYTVHTTVRSLEKALFLNSLDSASERLKIFPGVDLLSVGSFEEAMTGCDCVLHTASPFFLEGGSEENLVLPAVEGTRNVLFTCKKLGVRKVVLTASTACVLVNYGTFPADHVYGESDWSPEPILREKSNWYSLSKTAAERVAWEMSKEENCPYELAVINPSLILGPQLPEQPHLNTSSAYVVAFLDGSMAELENSCRAIVDVRDVAEAHVAALEKPEAMNRRFILIGGSPHLEEIANEVRSAVPSELAENIPSQVQAAVPPTVMGNPPPSPILYDVSPSVDILGIKYHSVADMVRSAVNSLLENGFSSKTMYSPNKL